MLCMSCRVCTLYVPVRLFGSEGVSQLVGELSRVLKRLELELKIVVSESESRIALVTPFGVFENGEIDVLIRQLSSLT